MFARQSAEPFERLGADDFQCVPQTHLVRGEHRLAEIALQPVDRGKRAPVAAGQHHRVGAGLVDTASNLIGSLRIEQTDIEIADEAERLLRQDL